MKTSLISGLLGASIALFGSPVFAQDAPASKKQQRVVVKKQTQVNSELLQKAAELSAKASALASEGDAAGAAKYAAEASAMLKKAQKAERSAERNVERSAERDVRVRVERDRAVAQDLAKELANVQSAEAHLQALKSYEEALKLHEHAKVLHDDHAELQKRYLELNAERGMLESAKQLQGQKKLQLRAHLGDLAELKNLEIDLDDLHGALSAEMGDLATLDLKGIDLTEMGIDLAGIEGANVQAFAFAMPDGEMQEGIWAMAPHDGHETHDVLLHRYLAQVGEACDCDCESKSEDCEDCENCCDSEESVHHAMSLFSAAVPHGEHASAYTFLPGENHNLERKVQIFVQPEGQEGMSWTSEGGASFGWTTEPGERNVMKWSNDANPFMHKENVEIRGEKEVRILRNGQGGEIIIHGGDGEQHIYINGHARGECTEDHDVHVWDGTGSPWPGAENLPQAPHTLFVPKAPKAPNAPKAPKAPQAPQAMLRLPNPQPSPRVMLRNHDGAEIRGRVIMNGEAIEYTTDGEGGALEKVRFLPRDASAPAPAKVKSKQMEAEQLIQEMRAEMEALRQELSDLRRQMKDDPLVRAQNDNRLEDVRVWRASMDPVADRKRAGLGSR